MKEWTEGRYNVRRRTRKEENGGEKEDDEGRVGRKEGREGQGRDANVANRCSHNSSHVFNYIMRYQPKTTM